MMGGQVNGSQFPGYPEPSNLEVFITVAVGTLLTAAYRDFVERLGLRGDERVLDFGSGAGTPARLIAERLAVSGHLTCLDVSQGWLEVARRRLARYPSVEYLLGDISDLAIADASFDVVVVHFTLHEIAAARRPEVVRHLARVLVPDGRLCVREPLRFVSAEEIDRLMAERSLEKVSSRVVSIPTQGTAYEGIFRRSRG